MADGVLRPGLHEALLTRHLKELLGQIPGELLAEPAELRNAEASDRISRHVAGLLASVIDGAPEERRTTEAIRIAVTLIRQLQTAADGKQDLEGDEPVAPGTVLAAL